MLAQTLVCCEAKKMCLEKCYKNCLQFTCCQNKAQGSTHTGGMWAFISQFNRRSYWRFVSPKSTASCSRLPPKWTATCSRLGRQDSGYHNYQMTTGGCRPPAVERTRRVLVLCELIPTAGWRFFLGWYRRQSTADCILPFVWVAYCNSV